MPSQEPGTPHNEDRLRQAPERVSPTLMTLVAQLSPAVLQVHAVRDTRCEGGWRQWPRPPTAGGRVALQSGPSEAGDWREQGHG